jgi:hypothetical protein
MPSSDSFKLFLDEQAKWRQLQQLLRETDSDDDEDGALLRSHSHRLKSDPLWSDAAPHRQEPKPDAVPEAVPEARQSAWGALKGVRVDQACMTDAEVLERYAADLPWGWEPVISTTQEAVYFMNRLGECQWDIPIEEVSVHVQWWAPMGRARVVYWLDARL